MANQVVNKIQNKIFSNKSRFKQKLSPLTTMKERVFLRQFFQNFRESYAEKVSMQIRHSGGRLLETQIFKLLSTFFTDFFLILLSCIKLNFAFNKIFAYKLFKFRSCGIKLIERIVILKHCILILNLCFF